MAIYTRLFVRCRTWRCREDINLQDIPGFYFWGKELKYEGPVPLRVTCGACYKTHKYKLKDVTVRYAADALRGVNAVVDPPAK
ncbi:MAG TPA: hypothetical protein VL990_18145 [Acidobacteriaceae bacterium]|nr:hypothetical protein [Acidobacteriaceae bacterium]